MSFLNRVLETPTYGYTDRGSLYVPSSKEIFLEFFSRLNFLRSKKNWLPAWGWFVTLVLSLPLAVFVKYYLSWSLVGIGFFYSMVLMGTHGTIYLHRYSTHRAFEFRNSFSRFIVRNLVIKIVPEEVYVISHHVHHAVPEQPGDPYNVHGGWLYCFLADVNHQLISRHLSQKDYHQLTQLMKHTGMHFNSYQQYLTWGSLCSPGYTVMHYALNWAFWYGAFYWIGGHALATAIFGVALLWGLGIRTFNYDGHGGGLDKRKDGIDFNRNDLSINRIWPGYVAGEWHNNHHLYPNSARTGFLPYQLDLAWLFIRFYSLIGGVRSFRDNKADFLKKHYFPYLAKRKAGVVKIDQTRPVIAG